MDLPESLIRFNAALHSYFSFCFDFGYVQKRGVWDFDFGKYRLPDGTGGLLLCIASHRIADG
jgi:hypothetical protein